VKRQARLLLLRLLGWLAPLLVRRSLPPSGALRGATWRILVIKPDHLGDMLMATPALRELRRRYPLAHISVLVGPWARLVLEGSDAVDAVHTLAFPGFERRAGEQREASTGNQGPWKRLVAALGELHSALLPYALLLRWALLLRAGRYDVAIVLRDDHWWGAALALLAGVPRRLGYAVPECRPLLSDTLTWDAAEHVTLQGLRLVAALEETSLQAVPATEPPRVPGAAAWADRWLRERGIGSNERLVVIHPGTGGQSKLWLPERWSAVGDALQQLPGVRLLVTGGPGEEGLVATVAGGMAEQPLTLAGTATVGQLAALLGRAALVLGVDSGPLHLAVAAGAPTIHLYGPGDSGRFGPWGDPKRQVVLRAGLFCSPCGVFTACPRATYPSECMALLSVTQVATRARTMLER